MKVVNPGNINAQPTADAADHQVRVRAKLPVVHLDGWDAVGGLEVSITREGDEAVLNEVEPIRERERNLVTGFWREGGAADLFSRPSG
jgi:hypothetical protein